MQDHATDAGVYIRSMSSRGHLGGLAAATPQAVRVLEGAGCDVVLVETVGVGQAEVEVASLADTTLVLLAPGMGDAIQAVKAGILEIADIFVVNKADRDGADATYRDIQGMISLGERGPGDWRPQVIRTVATSATGLDELVAAIEKHRDWLVTHGELQRRREARAAAEIEAIALGTLRAQLGSVRRGTALPTLAAAVAAAKLDPHTAAATLLRDLEVSAPPIVGR
jgi:LAO/AO transport system kinase